MTIFWHSLTRHHRFAPPARKYSSFKKVIWNFKVCEPVYLSEGINILGNRYRGRDEYASLFMPPRFFEGVINILGLLRGGVGLWVWFSCDAGTGTETGTATETGIGADTRVTLSWNSHGCVCWCLYIIYRVWLLKSLDGQLWIQYCFREKRYWPNTRKVNQ